MISVYHNNVFGETTLDTLGVTRQGYIGKEKDVENGLGDHGVRKYDYETGRFNSIDPLWEKYYGWTPYQYCMNNPISNYDDNGKWVKEISNEKHRHSGTIERNSNGYLAQKINHEFYEKWKTNAPAIAEYVEKSNIFVMQKELPKNNPANAEVGGNLMNFDLSQSVNLESETLHEITHLKGATEFQAYSAQFAAGLLSREDIITGLTTLTNYEGFNKHFRKGMSKEIRSKFFDGSGFLLKSDDLRNEFFKVLRQEGDKWIK